ncbi:MAG: NAD(P)-dependent oxidoreductase [Marinilabiliales bacterium]|nr:MAG: NAD(P)-dependent oxidoreductase [Marinilabiliales bacterium]
MESQSVIVITGSTRGIGHGLAKEFLNNGHKVVFNGRSQEAVDKVLEEFKDYSSQICGVAGDVSMPDTHEKLFDEAVKHFGKVDIWINNAGIPQENKPFVELKIEDIKRLSDINIYGLILGSQIAANLFLKQGYGKVFNMEGFGSKGRIMKNLTLYGTSKRAVNYFTKSLAKELDGSSVKACVLSPGMVRTEFLDGALEDKTTKEAKQFQKVYKVIAEDVDVVTKFLVKRILKSTKNYDRIEFLTPGKMMIKGFKMMF